MLTGFSVSCDSKGTSLLSEAKCASVEGVRILGFVADRVTCVLQTVWQWHW